MSFTIKRIIIRHRAYIGVWKKGRRGIFALKRQTKGVTKKEVERILNKRIEQAKEVEEKAKIFRITATFLYFYPDGTRVGRLRLVVYTLRPNAFNTRVMRRLLLIGDSIIKKERIIRKLGVIKRPLAREEHEVDLDEFRRSKQSLEVVFGEVAGFGLRQRKFPLKFK